VVGYFCLEERVAAAMLWSRLCDENSQRGEERGGGKEVRREQSRWEERR
jgi:hypothetical protein